MFFVESKYTIENALESLPPDDNTLDLASRGLTTLVHTDCMVTMETVNLAHNALQRLPGLCYLQGVKVLNLDGNKLSTCEDFHHLSLLEELSICDNSILFSVLWWRSNAHLPFIFSCNSMYYFNFCFKKSFDLSFMNARPGKRC